MLARKANATDRARHAGPQRRVRAAISTERATAGLTALRLRVAPEHVVFVKGVVEASEGLACLFAERGGDLCIAAPHDRAADLRELLLDLAADLGGTVDLGGTDPGSPDPGSSVDLEAPRPQGAPQAAAAPG